MPLQSFLGKGKTFKYVFIYLKGRLTERKREEKREIFHLLVPFSDACTNWSWARLSPRPKNSSRSPMWIQEPKYLGHLPLLSQAIIRELDLEESSWDMHQKPWGMPGIKSGGFAHCTTMPVPEQKPQG